jgi:hypothetical protein
VPLFLLTATVVRAAPPDPILLDPLSLGTNGIFDGPTALLSEPARLPRDGADATGVGASLLYPQGPSGFVSWHRRTSGVVTASVSGADYRGNVDTDALAERYVSSGLRVRGGAGLGLRSGERLVGASVYADVFGASGSLTGGVADYHLGTSLSNGDGTFGGADPVVFGEFGQVTARDRDVQLVVGTGSADPDVRPGLAFTVTSSTVAERVDYRVVGPYGSDHLRGASTIPQLTAANRRWTMLGFAWSRERGTIGDPDRRTEGWLQLGLQRLAEPVTHLVTRTPTLVSVQHVDATRGTGPKVDVQVGTLQRVGAEVARVRFGPTLRLRADVLPERDRTDVDPLDTDPGRTSEAWSAVGEVRLGIPCGAELSLGRFVAVRGGLIGEVWTSVTDEFDRNGDSEEGFVSGSHLVGSLAMDLAAENTRFSFVVGYVPAGGAASSVLAMTSPSLWIGWSPPGGER